MIAGLEPERDHSRYHIANNSGHALGILENRSGELSEQKKLIDKELK